METTPLRVSVIYSDLWEQLDREFLLSAEYSASVGMASR